MENVFKFPKKLAKGPIKTASARRPFVSFHAEPILEPPEGLIYGARPDSVEEWRVAVALWKYRIPFDYQVWVRGGRSVRGGQVVDFVLHIPYDVPLQVFGTHWHSGQLGADDQLQLAVVQAQFGRPAKIIWAEDIPTQRDADVKVREVITYA